MELNSDDIGGAMTKLIEEVKTKSKEFLGYELNVTGIRLIPYIQYCLLNNRYIESRKTNNKEKLLISKWIDEGYIIGDVYNSFTVTKEFWNFMCDILWLSYVNIDYKE